MSIVSETITVLKSQQLDMNIKRFRLENGKLASLPVKLPLLFDVEEHAVSSLSDLSSLLTSLEHDPSKFIIRGELIEGREKKTFAAPANRICLMTQIATSIQHQTDGA